ncbi:MAG: aldo/keto reductase [Armatimonadota bacterium]|nr:aldo/keto reductase [Armatimonadota bacterium]
MEYIKYGNAGIVVSRFCWGAMNFFEREGEDGSIRMVHEALDAGINFFDTADAYGNGKSEEVLGKALQAKRDHVILATKLWVHMVREDKNGRGCGRYHMMRAVEDSLRRLGTDRIDLYQLHHPDKDAAVEETLSTLDTLVRQGKIRYVGVSNHYAWQMAHMLGVSALHNWEPLVSIQCHYNILNRAVENETMHFCRRFNIAAITYGPLSGGVLSGKVKRHQPLPEGSRVATHGLQRIVKKTPGLTDEQHIDRIYDVLDELEKIAAKYNLGSNQLAVKWLLSKDWVTCPILGGSRAEHFSSMYNLFDVAVDDADLKRIDEISEPFKYVPWENQAIVQGAAEQKNWW